jgi:transcriptional regulator with XRE-family HTH domain
MSTRRPKVRYLREVSMKVISKERLADRRKKVGLTQYQLAGLCRCTQAAISALETGAMTRCSEDLAEVIAKWLARDVDELFERKDDTRVPRVTNALGTKRQSEVAA